MNEDGFELLYGNEQWSVLRSEINNKFLLERNDMEGLAGPAYWLWYERSKLNKWHDHLSEKNWFKRDQFLDAWDFAGTEELVLKSELEAI